MEKKEGLWHSCVEQCLLCYGKPLSVLYASAKEEATEADTSDKGYPQHRDGTE